MLEIVSPTKMFSILVRSFLSDCKLLMLSKMDEKIYKFPRYHKAKGKMNTRVPNLERIAHFKDPEN